MVNHLKSNILSLGTVGVQKQNTYRKSPKQPKNREEQISGGTSSYSGASLNPSLSEN